MTTQHICTDLQIVDILSKGFGAPFQKLVSKLCIQNLHAPVLEGVLSICLENMKIVYFPISDFHKDVFLF